MKILYGIQCTGNGHISRSTELVNELKKHVNVDVLTSGGHAELKLPFEVKYQQKGLSYYFGTNGSFDFRKTAMGNNMLNFLREVKSLPVKEYDMVISDFEPITAWAAFYRNVYCAAVSNQITLTFNDLPRPQISAPVSKFIINAFCPHQRKYGFHYTKANKYCFYPPIKSALKNKVTREDDYYMVYLPFFGDEQLAKALNRFPKVKWKVFSKHCKSNFQKGNCSFQQIDDASFNEALLNCKGIFCGAGFSTTSEALYLGKKLLILPMRNQYEQECNAFSLKNMGILEVRSLEESYDSVINKWLASEAEYQVEIWDETRKIANTILTDYVVHQELNGEYVSV